ncbi:MAG: MBL fold metallo-hydrolase [Thermoanaerobaculia bacterium]|jgi:L-ascorbate metabolism protein UlaG (beta-lactamase superfamily)
MPFIDSPPAIEITYVGGPTAIIEVAGLRFLTDPTFDVPAEYKAGSVTLEKTEGPAIPADEVGKIDAVLLSHDQHPDNLDPAGRALIAQLPTLTTRAGAARLGGSSIGMSPWESREYDTPSGTRVRVTATPARHGPAGIETLVGDVIGFVISTTSPQRDLVYVTGDTVWYAGTAEVARRFHPAAVLLFAGAARTRGPFHLTMDTNDAVELAVAFPDAAIVPVHHSGWAHFSQSQDDLIKTFEAVKIAGRLRPVAPARKVVIAPYFNSTH